MHIAVNVMYIPRTLWISSHIIFVRKKIFLSLFLSKFFSIVSHARFPPLRARARHFLSPFNFIDRLIRTVKIVRSWYSDILYTRASILNIKPRSTHDLDERTERGFINLKSWSECLSTWKIVDMRFLPTWNNSPLHRISAIWILPRVALKCVKK